MRSALTAAAAAGLVLLATRRPQPFAVILRPDERRDEGPDPTRPFCTRADTFVNAGIGGWWGCVGVELRRSRRSAARRLDAKYAYLHDL